MSDVIFHGPTLIEVPNVPEAKSALVDFCISFQDRWGKIPVLSLIEKQHGERIQIRTQYESARNMADFITERLP